MAVFNCKSCGADLDISGGNSVVTCEYCHRTQTIPIADDDKKIKMLARAQSFRRECEFDKAASIYESIADEYPLEAETYWELCLCKYGIQYVEDPATGNRLPTCHRASRDNILEDPDFIKACDNSDAAAVSQLRTEAKEINRLCDDILKIAENEDPYDVFICYKESDENGERTEDSEIAMKIYEMLIKKGYNVFFSRMTLRDKLGQDYEPYIFSALNSAKVMLAIGTKYEYYNAVWVRNEWSRYLSLMKTDKTKKLIPCYKDIDPYDLPKEFRGIQGQDMSSFTASQELLANIEGLIPKGAAAASQDKMLEKLKNEVAKSTGGATNETLLERVFEDNLVYRHWDEAIKRCNQVLDSDSKNARACLGMLMARLKVSKESDLDSYGRDYSGDEYYIKALAYSDEASKKRLEAHLEATLKYITERDKSELYDKSVSAYNKEDFATAKNGFAKLPGYRDADEWLQKATAAYKAQSTENRYQGAKASLEEGEYDTAKEDFDELGDYKESRSLSEECSKRMGLANSYYDKCRAIFKSYDENEPGQKAPALQELLDHRSYMSHKFKWFDAKKIKYELPEPQAPKKMTALLLPSSIGIIVSSIASLVYCGVDNGANNNDGAMITIFAALFIGITAAAIATRIINNLTWSLGKSIVTVIGVITSFSLILSAIGRGVDYGETYVIGWIILGGFILLGAVIIRNIVYFRKKSKIKGFVRGIERLEQLLDDLSPSINGELRALADDYPDIRPRISELTKKANAYYKNPDPDAGRIFKVTKASAPASATQPETAVFEEANSGAAVSEGAASETATSKAVERKCPGCGNVCTDPDRTTCSFCGAKLDK